MRRRRHFIDIPCRREEEEEEEKEEEEEEEKKEEEEEDKNRSPCHFHCGSQY